MSKEIKINVHVDENEQPIIVETPQYFAPVQSVNGKIGFVTLNAQDIQITGLATSGDLLNYVTKNSGQFINRPFVNGTGILLSGEAAKLPDTIVYTTGDQIISGSKTFYADSYIFSGANVIFVQNTGIVNGDWQFIKRPTVNTSGVLLQGEIDLSVYATVVNLATTGSTLQTNINTVAGNLATTGSTLQSGLNTIYLDIDKKIKLNIEYMEEFLNNFPPFNGGLQRVNVSPGTVSFLQSSGNQGVVRCETTNAVTNGLRAAISNNVPSLHFGQGAEIETVWKIRPSVNLLSPSIQGVYGVGFAHDLTTTAFANSGMFFRSTNGGPWTFLIRYDNIEDVRWTGSNPILDTWYTFGITVNSDASNVKGYLNKQLLFSFDPRTSVVRPDIDGRQAGWSAGVRRQTASSSNIGLDIDFAYLRITYNSERW